ncbi:MAG: TonB-dependent receptor plug domain-containing protein [Gammaproteobacteria bacterium]|nr:TonB-dependent receptor plug domain-containing protein [Gammaproteobacteria bacterium]MYH85082.1 TonB-dependent receptor plug domain-containing protein [Gammaproteobacteria bacterium]MYK05534.1 TonB-dependent receptor plug domain-containing protein [Gammaproteobacteria bacterium]
MPKFTRNALAVAVAIYAGAVLAQDETEIEEVIVVGSQIRGASISDALAVSVVSVEDIEIMGVDSGDELLALIPENGQNFFNEAENISGGVNSGRGDVGAFNLRNLGTGNTLVLLNGRRMVNSATYQTEEVGGSFIPVNTVNSQHLPVWGIERVEILRDGASAIYGADAVAGVVNTVLKDDFEGFNVRFRHSEFENVPGTRQSVTGEWGRDFNNGRTNVGVFFNFYQRDRVSSNDDPRWADSDFRRRIPADSPWSGNTRFRNNSANGLYPQMDITPARAPSSLRGVITDSAGEFETYPAGDSRCQYPVNATTCGAVDGQGTHRYDLNGNNGAGRDLASELKRSSVFALITHEFDSGVESFSELSYYQSSTNMVRHPGAPFSSVKLEMGPDNPYNPLGSGPGRLSGPMFDAAMADVPAAGLNLLIDNYRFGQAPRIVDNDGDMRRLLQGLRGTAGDWDWETAVSYSKATKDDVTRNRQSNSLAQEALNDSSMNAFNPFDPTFAGSNIERILVDVYRKSETELTTFDVKLSNDALFEMPAGPVAGLVGFEWREEAYDDDRDPRLDGTIRFTDYQGDTYPYVSDVVNSSPTGDSNGQRDVSSVFAELQIPLLENLDVQLALRNENYSDLEESNVTVGKFAFGYRPIEEILLRGSWSETFRAPNLVTVNEGLVARSNTRTDWACVYADEATSGAHDLDCSNSTQRSAQGSELLVPETGVNTSIGFALVEFVQGLTFTADWWSLEKEDTIGLFGEENHMILDLHYRLQAGAGNCSMAFNSAVVRDEPDDDQIAAYTEAGICPAGTALRVDDAYANLDTRTLEGHDIAVYYDLDTDIGNFRLSYNVSFLDEFTQEASGNAALLVASQAAGEIPADVPIDGFADLIGRDGNQDERHSARLSWRQGDFGASLAMFQIGSFYQSSLTLSDGMRYVIPSMTTYDATFDYRFEVSDVDARARLGIKNLTDERAPLADRFFGYFADAHTDYGRYMYLDIRLSF